MMNEREMFEESFKRPKNYFSCPSRVQHEIDAQLGILDWQGKDLTPEDLARFRAYYTEPTTIDK